MRLVKHPASAPFPRNPDKSRPVRARRIDVVINDRARRIADTESLTDKPGGNFSLFLVTGCAGPEPFIEESDPGERRGAERHVRAEYPAHFHHVFSMVGNRQIEPRRRSRAYFCGRVLGGEYPSLHGGELGMVHEKALDLVQVIRSGDEIIVEAHDHVTGRLPYRRVLNSAFSRPWIM